MNDNGYSLLDNIELILLLAEEWTVTKLYRKLYLVP